MSAGEHGAQLQTPTNEFMDKSVTVLWGLRACYNSMFRVRSCCFSRVNMPSVDPVRPYEYTRGYIPPWYERFLDPTVDTPNDTMISTTILSRPLLAWAETKCMCRPFSSLNNILRADGASQRGKVTTL